MRLWPWALGLWFVSCLMAQLSQAQTAPTAATPSPAPEASAPPSDYDSTVDRGLAAFSAGKFDEARALFERAHAQYPNARTWRALGLIAVEQKRFTRAQSELRAAVADQRHPLTESQRAELKQMLDWMDTSLATLRVHTEPPQARVEIDGQAAEPSNLVEPGKHVVRVAARGFEDQIATLEVAAAEVRDVTLSLIPLPAPDPRTATVTAPTVPTPSETAAAAADANGERRPIFAEPVITPVSATPAEQAEAKSGSILKKWWFWTAVGVVVVAGGTAVAVAASSGGSEKKCDTNSPLCI